MRIHYCLVLNTGSFFCCQLIGLDSQCSKLSICLCKLILHNCFCNCGHVNGPGMNIIYVSIGTQLPTQVSGSWLKSWFIYPSLSSSKATVVSAMTLPSAKLETMISYKLVPSSLLPKNVIFSWNRKKTHLVHIITKIFWFFFALF